jgi:hypothetical protein
MIRLLILTLMLAGCGTTLNLPVVQPNLQTINLGQPNCHMDCHTTQTATQSIGDGDVSTGDVTSSTSTKSTKSVGGAK